MKFFLDECVPRKVAVLLRGKGHWARTVSEARRFSLGDDLQMGYADSIDATFLSGDVNYYNGRRKRREVFGCHVLLECPKVRMVRLVDTYLADLLRVIAKVGEGMYRISEEDGVTVGKPGRYPKRRWTKAVKREPKRKRGKRTGKHR